MLDILQQPISLVYHTQREIGLFKVAPKKSLVFSTCVATREWLSQKWWGNIQSCITVVMRVRELGTHVNVMFNMRGIIIGKRLRQAAEAARRIARRPLPYALHATLIRTLVLALARYGTESAH